MKKIMIVLLIVTMGLTFIGCNSATANNESQKNITMDLQLEEIEDLSTVPEEFKAEFESLAKNRGFKIFKNGEHEYLLFIALGEKNTAGFDLVYKDIEDANGKTTIIIEELKPDGMVAEVISYPYKVFWLKGDIKDISNVTVRIENGEELTPIINNLKTSQGIYGGRIDNHSVEIKINEQPYAFQILDIIEEFEALNLNDGEKVSIVYDEQDNQQFILRSIERLD